MSSVFTKKTITHLKELPALFEKNCGFFLDSQYLDDVEFPCYFLCVIKTSFGEMDVLLRNAHGPRVEFLKFQREGRAHTHKDYESFFVMSGSGVVYVGDEIVKVAPGSLVVIPPGTKHWMKPDPSSSLEGLLWYHPDKLELSRSA